MRRLASASRSTGLFAEGKYVGAVHTPLGAAPVERDAAGFEPGDQGLAGHAEEYGSLAGRKHLAGCRRSIHVIVDDVGEDRVEQLGCGS